MVHVPCSTDITDFSVISIYHRDTIQNVEPFNPTAAICHTPTSQLALMEETALYSIRLKSLFEERSGNEYILINVTLVLNTKDTFRFSAGVSVIHASRIRLCPLWILWPELNCANTCPALPSASAASAASA